MTKVDLQSRSEQLIRDKLRKHLPSGSGVYLFGSRARHTANWNSDYDLWIDADISEQIIHEILEKIDDSIVPFKVDIVTTPQLRGDFGAHVRLEAIRWM